MNILIVSSYLPYPLTSGGHIRLYNLIKQLHARGHTITLVCEKRTHQTGNDKRALQALCKQVVTIERKKQWSLSTVLRTGFSMQPFLVRGHTLPEMRERIQQIINDTVFDVIHVETFYVMQNLPKTSVPVVLVEHNIEYLVYKRYIATVPLFMKPLLAIDVKKLTYWEKKCWQRADALVAVSEQEKKLMGKQRVYIVPNGVDTEHYHPKYKVPQMKKRLKKILFIGDFKWIQNSDAATTLLTRIWPNVQHEAEKSQILVQLWIVGKAIPSNIRKLTNDAHVVFDEHAPDDTALIYRSADILLAPIHVGGGTSYKILEAMASGVPVVTTSLGAEGIAAVDGNDMLVGEADTQLASHTISLLSDPVLYDRIATNARKVIEKNYDWNIIVNKLEDVYRDTIEKK